MESVHKKTCGQWEGRARKDRENWDEIKRGVGWRA